MGYLALETVVKATPLVFTALAFALAAKAGLVNIGAEGQFLAGALCATVAALACAAAPAPFPALLSLAAGCAGGALWGGIAALLKTRFGAHEVITTLMLNAVIVNIVILLLGGSNAGVLADPSSGGYPVSPSLAASAELGILVAGSRVHAGIIVAAAALVFYAVLMTKNTAGYEFRVVGASERAAEYAGMNVKRLTLLAMLLAGAFAGAGGAVEILAVQHRLLSNISANYGFDGIAVALVGRNKALPIAAAALLFGFLKAAAFQAQLDFALPASVVLIIEGIVILVLAGVSWKR